MFPRYIFLCRWSSMFDQFRKKICPQHNGLCSSCWLNPFQTNTSQLHKGSTYCCHRVLYQSISQHYNLYIQWTNQPKKLFQQCNRCTKSISLKMFFPQHNYDRRYLQMKFYQHHNRRNHFLVFQIQEQQMCQQHNFYIQWINQWKQTSRQCNQCIK